MVVVASAAAKWRLGWWRQAGFALLLLAGRRSARLVLACLTIGILLWLLLTPVWQELASGAVLPPDVSATSLQLDGEALLSVAAVRRQRAERPASDFGHFSRLFFRAPGESAAAP